MNKIGVGLFSDNVLVMDEDGLIFKGNIQDNEFWWIYNQDGNQQSRYNIVKWKPLVTNGDAWFPILVVDYKYEPPKIESDMYWIIDKNGVMDIASFIENEWMETNDESPIDMNNLTHYMPLILP